jgi:tRNA A37 threonylcarbamoyladenosine synthetase subunit TsaC/SUA5/YrdC
MLKKIHSLSEFKKHLSFFIKESLKDKIFVYPTDTIYWIWGVYNDSVLSKIYNIKIRDKSKIFSIIAPSFERIEKKYGWKDINLLKKYLSKYHGVTYIFDYDKPWVRILKNHFIQEFVKALWKPFITTSCNISWETTVQNLINLNSDMAGSVDYIIEDGVLSWSPSVLIDLVKGKIIKR